MPPLRAGETEVRQLIHAAARYLDDRAFAEFIGLFDPDGRYRIQARAPELPEPMVWMDLSRDELETRCVGAARQEWEILQFEQTRLLSIDRMTENDDGWATSTSVAIYHTDPIGRSSCYAVGRYDDQWCHGADAWLLMTRNVVLKTRILTPQSPLPL